MKSPALRNVPRGSAPMLRIPITRPVGTVRARKVVLVDVVRGLLSVTT